MDDELPLPAISNSSTPNVDKDGDDVVVKNNNDRHNVASKFNFSPGLFRRKAESVPGTVTSIYDNFDANSRKTENQSSKSDVALKIGMGTSWVLFVKAAIATAVTVALFIVSGGTALPLLAIFIPAGVALMSLIPASITTAKYKNKQKLDSKPEDLQNDDNPVWREKVLRDLGFFPIEYPKELYELPVEDENDNFSDPKP